MCADSWFDALGPEQQQRGFVAEHRELLQALVAHDAERAEALAIQHQEHAKELLLATRPEDHPETSLRTT